ncbi:hypothetical protein ACSVDE_17935 [Pseudalkalibacillus sp. Hm43]|uniref:hypothetical protein n=1 Tax=Pseudalkalibacillus sp. Hm43 TaxID=3450742 RepID=UPI003F440F6D
MKKVLYPHVVDRVVEELYDRYPNLKEQFGEKGVRKCREDNEHHLRYLETSYELDNVQFFVDYALWLNGILQKHGMSAEHLRVNFEIIKQVMDNDIEEERKEHYEASLDEALKALSTSEIKTSE